MSDNWRPSQTASAVCNQDFILLETFSGYRRKLRDVTVPGNFLDPSVSDAALGTAVIRALAASRQIPPEEFGTFFDVRAGAEHEKRWVSDLKGRFGYKTKRELFRNLMSVSVSLRDDRIEFMPFRQDGVGCWIRTNDDGIQDVVIDANSEPSDVGKALRQAFANSR
jgi:hypothetical protein